ncbi:hypothetical protein G6F24_015605 [Rhizopus arrhizus]|nr:hypothetical protein G6F24_015605 [Rhizopus arrhizus]
MGGGGDEATLPLVSLVQAVQRFVHRRHQWSDLHRYGGLGQADAATAGGNVAGLLRDAFHTSQGATDDDRGQDEGGQAQ